MRLHRLEITAFGPFADPVAVDLDQLSNAGLFLLCGPTGAGKTSVLDAICFALYGDVPGDRSDAKRLRCDVADPGVVPRVVLEATLAGRRVRIERSPAWDRPRKRGAGTTRQQASVTLSERVDDAWFPLSSRIDEAAHLIGELLGMTLTQFTQVALLPQGRFQAFLRSPADERQRLLQRLFRTERFEDVERWLRDRRIELRRGTEEHRRAVADLLSRISEAVRAPVPVDRDVDALDAAADAGRLSAWSAELADAETTAALAATAAAEAAAATEQERRLALESARDLHERHGRLAQARDEEARLRSAGDAQALDVAALATARTAAVVVPAMRRRDDADTAAATALAQADRALDDAAQLDLADMSPIALERARDLAADAVAAARAALPRQQRLVEVDDELAPARDEVAQLDARYAGSRQALAALPDRRATALSRLAEAEAAADGLAEIDHRLGDLDDRLAAHEEAARLAALREDARAAWLDVREASLAAREEVSRLREVRIGGMAAEIAGTLAVGACCPVCGSADHPAKAVSAPGAPDGDAEDRAGRRVDDLQVEEHARDSRVRELDVQLGVAASRAGDEPADVLRALRSDLAGRRGDLLPRAADAEPGRCAVRALLEEGDAVGRESRDAEVALERARATVERLMAERAVLAAEMTVLLDGTGADDLGDLLEVLELRRDVADAALRAMAAASLATEAARRAGAELAEVLTDQDVADEGAVRRGHLSSAEIDALGDRVARHAQRVAAVRAVLADPALVGLDDQPRPDPSAATAAHTDALERLTRARSAATTRERRRRRLAGLRAELDERLAAWAPLRAEHAAVRDLAAFVEGKAGDNRWQMRLSAYVLAYRLAQVVAAANERLTRMSDRRYSLEHTGRRGAKDRRGGLGLMVRDDWSGEDRDPVTLSGGETFVVSLALALGLADVITREAGGADLDTLFVDEGFGSLDAETLEDVLDTLDALREGGRVVGVVSHVTEMRERIPTRLEVRKARTGSALTVRHHEGHR